MKLKDVFGKITFQTMLGWTLGYLASIFFHVVLKMKFDTSYWLSLGAVLIVRVALDIGFAIKEARAAR